MARYKVQFEIDQIPDDISVEDVRTWVSFCVLERCELSCEHPLIDEELEAVAGSVTIEVIPNIGICEECGAENRRLYIVDVEERLPPADPFVPLCRKYTTERVCDHVHQIGCEADCCQLCALTACEYRCDPAKGLDEEGT